MMKTRLPKLALWFALVSVLAFVLPGCLKPLEGPVVVLSGDIDTGSAPLDVGFDLSSSTHSQGQAMTFELNFGDGSDPVSGTEFDIIIYRAYEEGGTYEATLLVIDEDGNFASDSLTITVDEEDPEIGIERGNIAPDFTGGTTNGGDIALLDYRGQVVLLEFWGAWCPPCRNSMPHLDDLATEYSDQGLVVIVISTDEDEQDTINFLATNGFTEFVSVWEPGGKEDNPIDKDYAVTSYPTTFVLDQQGIIRWVGHPLDLSGARLEVIL